MSFIGVDIGGTKIRAARVLGDICQAHSDDLIPNKGTENEVLKVIKRTIQNVLNKNVKGIGVGVPSLVDSELGIVYDVQNIPSWKKVNLKNILESFFNIPVFINNDANCFALGELNYGIGKNLNSFVALTIGTGIAGGIIIEKKIYNGSNFGAGEFGMLSYKDDNFESYCSGQFFTKKYNSKGENLFNLAKAGNKESIKIFNEFGEHLGNLINHVMYTYDPDEIILGGSVSKSYDFFKIGISRSLNKYAYQNSISNLNINVSRDQDIPVKGAASLCLKYL